MKKIIRIICFVLSAVCIVLNIGPVITNAQMNIGIIAGLLAAVILFTYGIKADKINSAISDIWKKKAGKAMITAVSLCIAAGIGIGGFALGKVVTYSMPSKNQTEYIIVLGCRVNGTQPGVYLRSRLKKALEYLEKNPESKAILSGGQGDNEDISEAECMFNYLTEAGISKYRLIIEDKSTSTLENFRNSLDILETSGISLKEITVVTNDFHEYRASEFAKRCGVTAYSYPCRTPWIGYVPFAVREVFAVVYQIYLR